MEELTMERMKIAYAIHVANEIVGADEVIDESEVALLGQLLPAPKLIRFNFLDSEGHLTDHYRMALEDAHRLLPSAMSSADKLNLLGELHRAALADGKLHPGEYIALCKAAGELGVPQEELQQHLDSMSIGMDAEAPPRRS